jgi:sulfite exporter TauE/SafE
MFASSIYAIAGAILMSASVSIQLSKASQGALLCALPAASLLILGLCLIFFAKDKSNS